MSDVDYEVWITILSCDEEGGNEWEDGVRLSDISHLYWESHADGIIVPRRRHPSDYSYDNVTFFFGNTPDMILSQQGFVQVHEKMFVPARNIVAIKSVTGGSQIEMGDLHPVFTRRDTLGLLLEWRQELLRGREAKRPDNLNTVAKVDRLIEQERAVTTLSAPDAGPA